MSSSRPTATTAWWTFAGGRANAALAHELARRLDVRVTSDNFAVRFPPRQSDARLIEQRDPRPGRESTPGQLVPPASEQALEGLKFSECLPQRAGRPASSQARLSDPRAVAEALGTAARGS